MFKVKVMLWIGVTLIIFGSVIMPSLYPFFKFLHLDKRLGYRFK
jgi:hypothetical protein